MNDAAAPTGHKMTTREELTLQAAADLEAAAFAWRALLTARDLFGAQRDGGPVDSERFDHLAHWLADDFDQAAHGFRRCDDALRLEIAKGGTAIQLAEPMRLEAVLIAAESFGIEAGAVAELVRRIANAGNLARADRHGVECLARFLDLAGYQPDDAARVPDRARAVSRPQLAILRALFVAVECDQDADDRRLVAWCVSRYGVEAPEQLDAATGWKAILYLRENLSARTHAVA